MIVQRQASFKPTDYDYEKLYSEDVTQRQLRKFLLRRFPDSSVSHWAERVRLMSFLLNHIDLRPEADVLDLATQIGTFAVEFAKLGHRVTGVDLSASALDAARQIRKYFQTAGQPVQSVSFVQGDISDGTLFALSSFDCITSADVFEHLHDDVLSSTLRNCERWLRPGGYLLFHTYPTKYDYLFYPQTRLQRLSVLPLVPLALLSDASFSRFVEFYHGKVINTVWKMRTGRTWEEHLAPRAHCNLLTKARLWQFLEQAGFLVLFIKAETYFRKDRRGWRHRLFGNKQPARRNLYGVAWKPLDDALVPRAMKST